MPSRPTDLALRWSREPRGAISLHSINVPCSAASGAGIIGNGSTLAGLVKLKLDLHEIYNRGHDIDRALLEIMKEAIDKKATLVEIIPGKGSGQLKKRVLRFLEQKEIKALYHRVEKDSDNFGRIFVHFRWK